MQVMMETIQSINVMGVNIRRCPTSQDTKQEKNCVYLGNGFCAECNCDNEFCQGGYLITPEWKRAAKENMISPAECACVRKARLKHQLKDSGLSESVDRCTFDTFQTPEIWQKGIKDKGLLYLSEYKGNSFFIAGQSGSGKTHICTAICNRLIESGATVKYFKWVQDSTKLKALVNDRLKYEPELEKYMSSDVLYIDDFLKQEITSADIRLAYEIIDGRYSSGKPVIISSERSIDFIYTKEEALAGRIMQMCDNGKYCIDNFGAEKNQRVFRSLQELN